LHDQVAEGDILQLFPPAGDLALSPSSKLLALISAGVGITQAMGLAPGWKASAVTAFLLLQRTVRRRQ
jgi:ferredoxin-NADP reductase